MDTVVASMAESQFYASVFVGCLQLDLDSHAAAEAFMKSMKSALPEFYAAVLVFSTRARGYFLPLGSGEAPCLSYTDRLFCMLYVLTLHQAKLTNYLEPFSITLEPCLQEIDANRKKLERLASMSTMERIKGRNEPRRLRLSAGDLMD